MISQEDAKNIVAGTQSLAYMYKQLIDAGIDRNAPIDLAVYGAAFIVASVISGNGPTLNGGHDETPG